MGLSAALNNVGRPGSVVEAGAAFRALHAAVASVELAAHAHGEAVRLVLAEELLWPQRGHVMHAGVVGGGAQPASDVIEVSQARMGFPHGDVIKGPHPLELAVADERIASEEEFGSAWKKYTY